METNHDNLTNSQLADIIRDARRLAASAELVLRNRGRS